MIRKDDKACIDVVVCFPVRHIFHRKEDSFQNPSRTIKLDLETDEEIYTMIPSPVLEMIARNRYPYTRNLAQT